MKVLQFPLIKITISFILGILVSHYFFIPTTIIVILLFFIFCLLLFSVKNTKLPRLSFGVLALVFAFLIGISTTIIHNPTHHKNHFINQQFDKSSSKFEVFIDDKIKSSIKNYRFEATILSINGKNSSGKIIVNLKKEPHNSIYVGQTLLINAALQLNKKNANPNQFDYSNYLEKKGIYGQIYTSLANVKIGLKTAKTPTYYASQFREKIYQNLIKNHFNAKELNVVMALIFGQQQDIDAQTLKDYQYAGAVHILSVSGLHIGCLLWFISFLLNFFIPNTKKALVLKLVISILFLWSFGFLAGFAPAVLRSIMMFSFVAIGVYLRRIVNIYNTLFASMFIILLCKPSFLFDVGFQLSYLAVFFIVWLVPLFNRIYSPKNWIIKKGWAIITVSFAAQIGTLPLSLYYFHQFPGLFFVTNIVVLTFMTAILVLALLVVVLAAFDVVWFWLAKLLESSIFYMNSFIAWVASLQFFVLKNIPLNVFLMLGLYLVFITIFYFFFKPNYKRLVFVLVAIVALQISFIFTKHLVQNKNEFIVFHQIKNTLITTKKGDLIDVYTNNLAFQKHTLTTYSVANFGKIKAIKKPVNFYYFNKLKVMLIDSSAVFSNQIKPDILILSHSPKINLERLLQTAKPKQIVADGSNYKSYIKIWKATCLKQKILFHDTSENGFYSISITK